MANGDPIASFSFALNSGYGDKQITTWLSCSLFGKRATTLAPMLLKGTKIGINGELTNRPYTAKDGTEKFSLDVRVNDVTLLGGKSDSNTQSNRENAPQRVKHSAPNDEFDPEIPF